MALLQRPELCGGKQLTDRFWYAFDSQVIKVKAEKSGDLLKMHSLICKLLAFKADDRKTDPDVLVHEIYQAAAAMKGKLDDGQLLLIDQWVDCLTR